MFDYKNIIITRFASLFYFFYFRLFWKWSTSQERPASGSLLQLVTKNSQTDVISA